MHIVMLDLISRLFFSRFLRIFPTMVRLLSCASTALSSQNACCCCCCSCCCWTSDLVHTWLTFDVWVRRLDSVAKPLPQMLQWNGRFFARSTWASWFRRCCCKFDNWMNARPQSGRWHLYGRSPETRTIFFLFTSFSQLFSLFSFFFFRVSLRFGPIRSDGRERRRGEKKKRKKKGGVYIRVRAC